MSRKTIVIGSFLAAILLVGLLINNKLKQPHLLLLSKDLLLLIFRKIKKSNYLTLKRVATMVNQLKQQYKGITSEALRNMVDREGVEKQLQANLQKICKELAVEVDDFNHSVQKMVEDEDEDIIQVQAQLERDFEGSFEGKIPQIKVIVPDFLTKARVLEIHKKIVLKKYLVQIAIFRKIRGKTQIQMKNPSLIAELPNADEEELRILEEQGLSGCDDPPTVVFQAGISKYRGDRGFVGELLKMEKDYNMILNRFKQRMESNRITEDELCQLEDELIYSNGY